MIIFFAGDGEQTEDSKQLIRKKSKNWGVLLSFKTIKTKSNTGSARFNRIFARLPKLKK